MTGAHESAVAAGPSQEARRRRRAVVTLALAATLLVAVVLSSFAIGPLRVTVSDTARIIADNLGLSGPSGATALDAYVVWDLRMPRVLMACIVGASLAVAGAALQGLFGNALADPGVIGVSGGASVGAIGAIVIGASALGQWTVPIGAFAGGLIATLVVYLLARQDPTGTTVTMLLVGIAIGAACAAITGFFTYIADDDELQELVFWQLGSLGSVDWSQVAAAAPFAFVGIVGVLLLSRPLDLLALGERQAQHLGVDVRWTRLMLVLLSAMLVGAAVAFAGSIGFVGLVVPHIVRLMIGPTHRWLVPTAALIGAILIVASDTFARTIDPPQEVPLGLFTAAIGAPFFLWLIQRQRPRGRVT